MTTRVESTAERASVADLAEIIRAYNEVTERIRESHEKLEAEVVRLRKELASTNAQLQRSKRLSALGEMAAGIAHEVRNPLGAIQLYVAMIIEDLAGPEVRGEVAVENARKVAEAVRGLNAIVGDVLSFAGETRPARRRVCVAELFARVADVHGPSLDAARVRLVRACGDEGGLVVHADAEMLNQALSNLVRNALEAVSRSAEAVVTLDAWSEEGQVVLEVRDTGPGIAESDVDRIFNPFFTTRSTGTGLGLAIVHRIVDAHGGSIAVHNGPSGGAVFRVFLPAGEWEPVEPAASAAHEVMA